MGVPAVGGLGRAVYGGVVYHFASGIEQTDSDTAGNENPMDGDEPQYRPPERVITALLPEAAALEALKKAGSQ